MRKTFNELVAENKKEYHRKIAKYMGGEIHPFKINGHTDMLWQNCEIGRINGCVRDCDLWIEKDWNAVIQVLRKISKESTGKTVDECTIEEWNIFRHMRESHAEYYIEAVVYWIVQYIDFKNKKDEKAS